MTDKTSRLKSINHYIPQDLCSVKYRDLDHALLQCLSILKYNPEATLWFGVSDLKSAFRVIPLLPKCWPLLVMAAQNPTNGKWYFFIDKCLPFGAAIKCKIFQEFSNALAHIAKFKLNNIRNVAITNYLDDFLKLPYRSSSATI